MKIILKTDHRVKEWGRDACETGGDCAEIFCKMNRSIFVDDWILPLDKIDNILYD